MRIAYYTDIMMFYVHTDFDLQKDLDKLEVLISGMEELEGISKIDVKRYSVEVQIGYLFNSDDICARALGVIEKTFGRMDSTVKLTNNDLLLRQAERLSNAKEPLWELLQMGEA